MNEKRKHMWRLLGMTVLFSAFVLTLFAPMPAMSQDFELKDMAILANDGIEIQGAFVVSSGNVCTRNGDIDLGGRATVHMDGTGTIASTANPAGAVILDNFARVGTVATASVLTIGSSGVSGPSDQIPPMECPADPPEPTFTPSFDAADDIVCTQAGTTIIPGNYRDLIVAFRGKCNFDGEGVYNFRSINADTNSSYAFNFLNGGCTPGGDGFRLNVLEFAFFGEYGDFNANNIPSVFLYVKGIDSDWPERTFKHPSFISPFTSTYPAFGYRGDGEFNACYVFAPNGTVAVKGKGDFHSIWIGKYFWEWSTLRVFVQPPGYFETCCDIPQVCISIFDFAEKVVCPGDTLTIDGTGLIPAYVDAVYFFPVGAPIADNSDPAASASCSQNVINFVNNEKMEIEVPAACPPGDYYLGIVDGNFILHLGHVLTIEDCI